MTLTLSPVFSGPAYTAPTEAPQGLGDSAGTSNWNDTTMGMRPAHPPLRLKSDTGERWRSGSQDPTASRCYGRARLLLCTFVECLLLQEAGASKCAALGGDCGKCLGLKSPAVVAKPCDWCQDDGSCYERGSRVCNATGMRTLAHGGVIADICKNKCTARSCPVLGSTCDPKDSKCKCTGRAEGVAGHSTMCAPFGTTVMQKVTRACVDVDSLVHQKYSKILCAPEILNHKLLGCASIAGSDFLSGRCRASCGKYCHHNPSSCIKGKGSNQVDYAIKYCPPLDPCADMTEVDYACPHHTLGEFVPVSCDDKTSTRDDNCKIVFTEWFKRCSKKLSTLGLAPAVQKKLQDFNAKCITARKCTAGAQLQKRANIATKRCCDEHSERCVKGVPQTCNADCAEVFLPFFEDCGKFLGNTAKFSSLLAKCRASFYGSTATIVNPAYDKHKYSSIWTKSPKGHNFGRGRLNSPQAWSAGTNRKGEWWQVDVGPGLEVVGVLTQGRTKPNQNQKVTAYNVSISLDGKTWTPVDGGKVFPGNVGSTPNTIVTTTFAKPVVARYVRIIVQRWTVHISMRAAVSIRPVPGLLPPKVAPNDRCALLGGTCGSCLSTPGCEWCQLHARCYASASNPCGTTDTRTRLSPWPPITHYTYKQAGNNYDGSNGRTKFCATRDRLKTRLVSAKMAETECNRDARCTSYQYNSHQALSGYTTCATKWLMDPSSSGSMDRANPYISRNYRLSTQSYWTTYLKDPKSASGGGGCLKLSLQIFV
eukprot:COSAG01_NODE_4471_length_4996_cov_2.220339_2_plen_763_part_00